MKRRKIIIVRDYSKLLGKIKECGLSQEQLAKKIGKDKSTINAKLNNQYAFTQDEIDAICRVLDISNEEIGEYFFAQ